MSDLDKINSIFNAKIDSIKSKEELQNLKTEYFGKNGQITSQFKNLGSLPPDKKKEFASELNKLIDDIYHLAKQKGAYGGKLSGAGGGGFLSLVAKKDKQKNIIDALLKNKMKYFPVRLESTGSIII